MRQAGRYSPSYQKLRNRYTLYDLFHNSEMIEEITLQPLSELGVDAAILFSDILIVLDAFGLSYDYKEGGPVVEPFKGDLDLKDDSFPFLVTAIKNLKKRLNVPLLGFAGAPYTLSTYIKAQKDLIKPLTEAVTVLLKRQIEAGVDAVQLFDSWAGHLDDEQFDNLVLKPLEAIQKEITVPLIFFCRHLGARVQKIVSLGVKAISLDCPLAPVRQKYGPSLALQGNLDPDLLMTNEKEIEKAVDELLLSMRGDKGFIVNLAHGVRPGSSLELVKHLVACAQEKGQKLWS